MVFAKKTQLSKMSFEKEKIPDWWEGKFFLCDNSNNKGFPYIHHSLSWALNS